MPLAVNSASRPSSVRAPTRSCTVSPVQSVIWLASVRFHTSSYSRASGFGTCLATVFGSAKASPAGRMASWASWAFFTLLAYTLGLGGSTCCP